MTVGKKVTTESCKLPLDEFQFVGNSTRYRISGNEAYLSLSKVKYRSTNSPWKKRKRYNWLRKCVFIRQMTINFEPIYTPRFLIQSWVYELHKFNSVCSCRPKCRICLKKQ